MKILCITSLHGGQNNFDFFYVVNLIIVETSYLFFQKLLRPKPELDIHWLLSLLFLLEVCQRSGICCGCIYAIDSISIYCYYLVKDTTNQQMKVIWKWNSNEIVSQYTKMVFVAHLKNKTRFTYRNFKFKIPLNCTDGTTLPQYGI
jgi:hypothetical protein